MKLTIHLLSGFLGSGKTSAIQQASALLMAENKKIGVITNDQGIKLVDGGFFNSLDLPNRQVKNGCFCCNYNDLDNQIESLNQENQPDVIFAESVGSCTDIVATVLKPLQKFRSEAVVTLSVFADVRLLRMIMIDSKPVFEEDVKYIYQKQLEEAGIIVVNKIDLVSQAELDLVKEYLSEKYPGKQVLYVNALLPGSVQQWLDSVEVSNPAPLSSLEMDYDKYGAGEAMLAWLDEELELFNNEKQATGDAVALMQLINRKIRDLHLPVGHLKFLLNGQFKITYTAIEQPGLDFPVAPSSRATLMINARVQTTPENLSQIVKDAIEEIRSINGTEMLGLGFSSFQPGYPRPTHRMAD